MKKLLPLILLTSLLLSACSFNGNNKEDLFQKKQECLSFETKMLEQGALQKKIAKDLEIKEIFYSPKINSCLYVTEYSIPQLKESKSLFNNFQVLTLTNYFSKEEIIELEGETAISIYKNVITNKCPETLKEKCESFLIKMKELKSE